MAKTSSAAAKQRAIKQRAARIQLLLMDVDGVWTDGSLYYVPSAGGAMVETKGFDSQDGIGLRWAVDAGLVTGIISGRLSPAVQERGRMLGLSYIYQDHLNKLAIYEQILAHARLTDSQVCFMGDDLTDLPVLRRAGLAVAVANGRPEVKKQARYVTTARGGRGAVRETIELILKAQNKWRAVVGKYGL